MGHALNCSLFRLQRLLVCSLAHSLAPELFGLMNILVQFSSCPESLWLGRNGLSSTRWFLGQPLACSLPLSTHWRALHWSLCSHTPLRWFSRSMAHSLTYHLGKKIARHVHACKSSNKQANLKNYMSFINRKNLLTICASPIFLSLLVKKWEHCESNFSFSEIQDYAACDWKEISCS